MDHATLNMERKDTTSTLDSPFGSTLNTPVDEMFQNLDGMLRIRSSDFTDSEVQDTLQGSGNPKVRFSSVPRKEYMQQEETDKGTFPSDSPTRTSLTTAAVVKELLTFPGPSNKIEHIGSLLLKLLLFLPWCALVGGTILLSPNDLEQITFQTGYISSPPAGILRFAHWTEFAGAHILSFVIVVCSLFWIDFFFGCFVVCVLVGRIVRTWNEVRIDADVALGEDDEQTIYILATKFFFNGSAVDLDMMKAGSKYYAKRGDGFRSVPTDIHTNE